MKKILLGLIVALPLALATEASALPVHAQSPFLSDAVMNPDLLEVKKGGRGGGGGWGRGGGFSRGHAMAPRGWSRGRKVGWRGRGCPPGHWKKGWC